MRERTIRNIAMLTALALGLCNTACGLLVVEPGYEAETYAEYGPTVTYSRSMVFDNAGNLYLNQPYDDEIWRVGADRTASLFASLPDTTSGFDWTSGRIYGDYLYTTANQDLVKIAPDGTVSAFASGFPAASEVAWDRTGNYGGYLYVSTGGQDHIYRVDPAGVVSMFTEWPGWTDGGGPAGLAFDTVGDYGGKMYVATWFGQDNASKSGVFAVDTDGTATKFAESLAFARELAFDTEGLFGSKMYVIATEALDQDGAIWRVEPDGSAGLFAMTTESLVSSLVFGPDGAMYVAEYSYLDGTVTVSRVIPEPATILLLGLGGIALLKRQKE